MSQAHVSHQVAKTTTAVTLGGSLMVLSGLTLAATVIFLVIATPLMVIFSPVLVPASIAGFLILAGFLAAGGFGASGTFVLYWLYMYAAGKRPIGVDQLDRARARITHAAMDIKEKAQQQIRAAQET